MPLELRPMEESDLRANQDIGWKTFKNGLSGLIWPNGFPEEARDDRVQTVLKEWRENPETIKLFKVVDTDLPEDDPHGKMVGFSKWKISPKPRSQEEMEQEGKEKKDNTFPLGVNKPLYSGFIEGIIKCRSEILGGQANIILDSIGTHPDHYRRGVAGMHLQWGNDMADKLDLPLYLEASPMARLLYARYGYEDVQKVQFDARNWGYNDEMAHYAMMRPARPLNGATK